jgi:hypothetical protein
MEQQRFIAIAGTFRNFAVQVTTDIPTFIRVDTQTGRTWVLEGLGGAVSWVDVTERGQQQP